MIKYFLLLFLTLSCAKDSFKSKEDVFSGLRGCFLLYDVKTRAFVKTLGESCQERLPPCSTFKVPLAVMAFDSGVLKDENVVLKWNGVREFREEANRDHNARTWMRDSIVWFSQRLTPKFGEKKFRRYLRDFNYGNMDISRGLTTAWIASPIEARALKINAYEQVSFMEKLWLNKLPVSKRSMELTREITFLETSPKGYKLNGKTGSNFYDKERRVRFGWFVSHLQRGEEEYIAVTNVSELTPNDRPVYGGAMAKEITKKILDHEGLW